MEDYRRIALLRFTTHAVRIDQDDTGTIKCFKYTDSRCDMATFNSNEEASDYILEPFPEIQYYVTVND